MLSLYELSREWERIAELAFEEADLAEGQIPTNLADELKRLEGDIDSKLENCCKVVRDLDATSEKHREASRHHAEKARRAEAHCERLKEYMQQEMVALGWDKRRCGLFTASIQKSPPKVLVVDMDLIPHEFDKPVKREVSLTEIGKALKDGREVAGVELVQSTHLRIR